VLADHYAGQKYVQVEALQTELEKGFVLTPFACNESNNLQLRVFWNEVRATVVLTACLDNLGKGASGAAVQNAELMWGCMRRLKATYYSTNYTLIGTKRSFQVKIIVMVVPTAIFTPYLATK